MAAGLNVIPLSTVANPMTQQFVQALRNLQVGRNAYTSSLAIIVRAVEATGGSAQDLATLFGPGISAAQAQIIHDEASSFGLKLSDATLVAAWNQINAIMGISV